MGASLDLLDGWIRDRYLEILDRLDWVRVQKSVAIPLPAEVNAGTVAVVNGSAAIAGTGTAWTAEMSGRLFRIAGQAEYYEFTFASANTGTLDRPFLGGTATGAAYRINALSVTLPANCRSIDPPQLLDPARPLEIRSLADIAATDPSLSRYAPPEWVAWQFDAASAPPVPQLRVWPVPVQPCTIVVPYTADGELGTGSGQSLLPWMRPGCIKAGVQADHARWSKELMAAGTYEARFSELLTDMTRVEASRTPPEVLEVAARHTRHRRARYWR